ncbi:hypothetical protein LMANV2_20024 [Leptospira interrogans serovar Manilae]|uniref:Uncharacterized protein n=1 Tax=Leptospira interrogans serovar Manilae TaxID=214675 RepID=A0AAQ1SN27_LEPIR|nr:hypothetical protein LMANV2_20024 [Leptospira interrogans serovar Manilae]
MKLETILNVIIRYSLLRNLDCIEFEHLQFIKIIIAIILVRRKLNTDFYTIKYHKF